MRKFFLVVLSVFLGLHSGCRDRGETRVDRALRDRVLHLGNGTEPQDLDPHLVTGVPEHNILSALLEGLITENPQDLTPSPGVAASWSVSEDGLTYTFYLRETARWSNGDPVTANDFLFSFKRILSPSLGAEYAYMLYVVENAEAYHQGEISDFSKVGFAAPDDLTLSITLRNATPYFLSLLNHYAWFPVHPPTVLAFGAMDQRGSNWTRPEHFVGNGPFVLDAWKLNHHVIVKKNLAYWDADRVRLNGIHFHPIESTDTEERAFRSGQLHVTSSVPLNKIERYRREQPDQISVYPYLGTYFYRLNVTRPPLDNVKVRRALSLALDRDALVDHVLKGGQLPARHFVPPRIKGYVSEQRLGLDLDQARRLLSEAGYPGGQGIRPLFLLYNTSEAHRMVAEAVQQMWKELGVEIALINQEWKVFLDSQRRMDYDICRAGWIGDYVDPNTFLDLFVTGGGNNHTGWSNPRYDRLLREGARARNTQQRIDILGRAERLLIDELPILPIYFYTRVSLVHSDVKGWNSNILDHHPYKYVDLVRSSVN